MRIIILLSLILAATGTVMAQQPSRGFPKAQFVGTVNFQQLIGGVILLEGRLDTISTPLNFILDTGSGGISLDSSTCDEFNIITTPSDTIVSGIGGSKKVSFVFDKTLLINKTKVEHLSFHINDYSILTGIYGIKIDGIIGYSLLNRYILKIDYEENKIDFYSPGELDYPNKGYILKPDFTRLPIQKVIIQDNRKVEFPFYFDTGAGLALLLSSKFDSDSSVIKLSRKPVTTSVEGLLGKSKMRLTISNKMKLGPYTFKNVPTYIYSDDNGIIGYPKIGGLLGSEIFRRFNLIINYPKREIHLSPNKNFDEEFDYSYTGMNLYFTDGKILIDDIIAGSPAAKAGLLIHDEIISVGTDISLSMESYRTTLRSPNTLLKIYVRRGNDLFELYLKVGTIM